MVTACVAKAREEWKISLGFVACEPPVKGIINTNGEVQKANFWWAELSKERDDEFV